MRYRVFFSCLLLVLSGTLRAEPFQDFEQVRASVIQFVNNEMQGEFAGIPPENIAISVSNLDSRLQLTRCELPLRQVITSPRPYGSNISVKVSCGGVKPWSIYVPTRVDMYAEVAVMANTLERGSILTEADVQLVRMNTTQAGFGHIRDVRQAVGKELKRRLQSGDAVRLSHLKSPQVVRKGDRVVVEATTAGVSVVTSGRALLNGQVGDQIQVRNEKSERVVDAEVVAPGRVKVSL